MPIGDIKSAIDSALPPGNEIGMPILIAALKQIVDDYYSELSGKLDSSAIGTIAPALKTYHFVATGGQTGFTVPENNIEDDGLWSLQVEGELWNSTSGITGFVNGIATINFPLGTVSFPALSLGTQVIFKYN